MARQTREGELGIKYACLAWLPQHGYPNVFHEVYISRGIGHGRVDVAGSSKDWTRTCAIEIKVHYREGDAEIQLLDARSAANEVWLAAPNDVTRRVRLAPSVGLLHPRPWPPRGRAGLRLGLDVARPAEQGSPRRDARRGLLHGLMKQALKRSHTPEGLEKVQSCPACDRLDCEHWSGLRGPLLLDEADVHEILDDHNPFLDSPTHRARRRRPED